MFRTDGSRLLRFLGLSLLALLLAVIGQWAFGGIIGGITLALAIGANVAGSACAPRIQRYPDPVPTLIFGAIALVAALIVGIITFGWWGLAYVVAAAVVYVFSAATNN